MHLLFCRGKIAASVMLESLLAIARQAKGAKSKPDNFVAICKNPAAHCVFQALCVVEFL
jgi:hypothetical protein